MSGVDLVPVGARRLFEYHCLESDESCDAQLWYRSHQPVTVVRMIPGDAVLEWPKLKRLEEGQLVTYRVKFDDGQEFDVFEDEVLGSSAEFTRPSPPLPPQLRAKNRGPDDDDDDEREGDYRYANLGALKASLLAPR